MTPESTTPSGQALPAGTRLEEFEIESVLGRGGFGITYLALDSSLGRKVVIKENLPAMFAYRETTSGTVCPQSETGEDADNFAWSMENFLREADTLASLDHPGIVSVLRKFEANGTAYFVMPFVEGVAFDVLERSRQEKGQWFADEELRGLLEHVLDALSYLHDRGIYHRDIKPGNILVTMEGVPILIDFGSARQRLSERSMTVVESAGYTPFEQLQSRGNVGPWSDLYALGATVAKAITGEAPPKAMDRMPNDCYEPLCQDLGLLERYSRPLLSSIDRALVIAETERWQTAEEWQQGLRVLETSRSEPRAVTPPLPVEQEKTVPPPLPVVRPEAVQQEAALPLQAQPLQAQPLQAAPVLWSPNAAANWSLLFTPLLGAWIQSKNWIELGEAKKAQHSMVWFYGYLAFVVFGIFDELAGPFMPIRAWMAVSIGILLAWYFSSGREQVKHFKQAGIQYRKRPYGLPLLTATGCLVGYCVVMFALTTALSESRYREEALAQIEAEWLADLDRDQSWQGQSSATRTAVRKIDSLNTSRMPKDYSKAVSEMRGIMDQMATALDEENEARWSRLEDSRQAKYRQLQRLSYGW